MSSSSLWCRRVLIEQSSFWGKSKHLKDWKRFVTSVHLRSHVDKTSALRDWILKIFFTMKLSFVAAISIILFVKTTFENPLINVGTSEVNISMINQWSFNYFFLQKNQDCGPCGWIHYRNRDRNSFTWSDITENVL